MNASENKPVRSLENDGRAREGRLHDKDGRDVGDAAFHEIAWGLAGEKERIALERQAAMLVELEEAQALGIADKNAEIGVKAFDELLSKYPDNERAKGWREARERLAGRQ
jgi:hypothetical protein